MTIAAGETILASDINAIKDVVDAIVSAAHASVGASETETSTSYDDMTTAGPAVTLTTDTTALVIVSAVMSNSGANQTYMSWAVSGASTVAASDAFALSNEGTNRMRASRMYLVTSLIAGSNTFTSKYKVSGGTGTIGERRIIVFPLGV